MRTGTAPFRLIGIAALAVAGTLFLSTPAARADWHGGGGGGWHGGGGGGWGWRGGGGGWGWHGGGGGWNGGGGWGWHGGRWACCWRGGVFIGLPPVYVPPPAYYPPPYYPPPPAYYPPPYYPVPDARTSRRGSGRQIGQKMPAASPAANVAPSSLQRARSSAPIRFGAMIASGV